MAFNADELEALVAWISDTSAVSARRGIGIFAATRGTGKSCTLSQRYTRSMVRRRHALAQVRRLTFSANTSTKAGHEVMRSRGTSFGSAARSTRIRRWTDRHTRSSLARQLKVPASGQETNKRENIVQAMDGVVTIPGY